MNEQIIILISLIAGTFFTLFLYIWKAKKEVEYKKDERWKHIQNKANNAANIINYIMIILFAVGSSVSLFSELELTFTLNRVSIMGILIISLRNTIELFALKYYDKNM